MTWMCWDIPSKVLVLACHAPCCSCKSLNGCVSSKRKNVTVVLICKLIKYNVELLFLCCLISVGVVFITCRFFLNCRNESLQSPLGMSSVRWWKGREQDGQLHCFLVSVDTFPELGCPEW